MIRDLLALILLNARWAWAYIVRFITEPVFVPTYHPPEKRMKRYTFDDNGRIHEETFFRWLVVTPKSSVVIFARNEYERDLLAAEAGIVAPCWKAQTPQPATVQAMFDAECEGK